MDRVTAAFFTSFFMVVWPFVFMVGAVVLWFWFVSRLFWRGRTFPWSPKSTSSPLRRP